VVRRGECGVARHVPRTLRGPNPIEQTSKLSPQEGCILAATLFPEEFKTNKARAILKALLWLAQAMGEEIPAETSASPQNVLIQQLTQSVRKLGLESVSKGIGVSPAALRSWLRGVEPNAVNHQRIEAFLRESETALPDAGAKEPARPGELFSQPQPGQLQPPETGS
jgi:hypothetical protein